MVREEGTRKMKMKSKTTRDWRKDGKQIGL